MQKKGSKPYVLHEWAFRAWNVGVNFIHGAEFILLVGVLWDECRSEARNTGSSLTPADDANLRCVYSAARIMIVNAGCKA